jgi:AAA ATPase domain
MRVDEQVAGVCFAHRSEVDVDINQGRAPMLERMRLRNFRGFEDHAVPFRDSTVIVGANNAGKSTLVEALRLVGLVTDRFRRGSGHFVPVPDWLDDPEASRGIAPARRGSDRRRLRGEPLSPLQQSSGHH